MLPGTLGRMLDRTPFTAPAIAHAVSNTTASIAANELVAAPARAFVEIPSFLTDQVAAVVRPAPPAERAFQSMLNIAMSGATKLAIFAGLLALSATATQSVNAQTVPPAGAAVAPTTLPATAPATSAPAAPTITAPAAPGLAAPQLPPAPKVEAPAFVMPQDAPRRSRTAQNRAITARPASTAVPKAVADSAKAAQQAVSTTAGTSKLVPPPSRGGSGPFLSRAGATRRRAWSRTGSAASMSCLSCRCGRALVEVLLSADAVIHC